MSNSRNEKFPFVNKQSVSIFGGNASAFAVSLAVSLAVSTQSAINDFFNCINSNHQTPPKLLRLLPSISPDLLICIQEANVVIVLEFYSRYLFLIANL